MPIVSVLMTAYNRECLISVAIESVLSSTLRDFELIIVDDCSTDNTYSVAKKYADKDERIKLHKNPKNLGDYNNRNKAASYAQGKYLKYLDSDDVMYSYTLQVLVGYMEDNPDAMFGLAAVPDLHKPYPVLLSPRETYLEHFLSYGHFDRSPGSSIIRRDSFNQVGGFSGERHVGDMELWFTLGRLFPMLKVPRDLVWARDHAVTESKREQSKAKHYNEVRKAIIEKELNNPDCPLNEEDIKKIRAFITGRIVKSTLKRVIYKAIKW